MRRSRRRGFTLVELMISLIMGLIVALAAVALAKAATTTFYEQARLSGVEASIRSASERLRTDISRASFMSTPNIQRDTKIARVPGTTGAAYRIPTLKNLQGIRILPDTAARAHPLSAANGNLQQQQLIVAGNLTTDDVYRGTITAQTGRTATIRLNSAADAAVRRLFAGVADGVQAREMTQLAFAPGEEQTPAVQGLSYAVQVMDARGCFHYMLTRSTSPVEISTQPNSVDINLVGDPAMGILTPEQTGGDVCGARLMEEVAIAPIHRAKWSLQVESEPRRIDIVIDEGATATSAPNKFNLTRQLLSGDTTVEQPVGPPEVVAEYAVDMRFGLSLDNTGNSGASSLFVNFEDPDTSFDQWGGADVSGSTLPNRGPQRLRTLRYRLAFRAPIADRNADLPMGAPYLARYCTQSITPCTRYARVRTIISEVALINQAQARY